MRKQFIYMYNYGQCFMKPRLQCLLPSEWADQGNPVGPDKLCFFSPIILFFNSLKNVPHKKSDYSPKM